MKNKRLVGLAVAFVLLVIVAVVVMQNPGELSIAPGEGEQLLAIDSALINVVEIISPVQRLTLLKEGAVWHLQDPIAYRADQGLVTSLIGQLKSLRSSGVISANPDKQGLFQVDSTGILVALRSSSPEEISLVIGKMGTSYSETYVRLAGSDEVHLVNAPLRSVVERDINDWRDKGILKVSRESIRDVRFQYGDTTFTLAFQDSLWTVGGMPADDGAINSLITSMVDVRADGFVDVPPVKLGLAKAVVSYAGIELRFYDGPTADSHLVQASSTDQWFEMKSWRAGQILKRQQDLREKTE